MSQSGPGTRGQCSHRVTSWTDLPIMMASVELHESDEILDRDRAEHRRRHRRSSCGKRAARHFESFVRFFESCTSVFQVPDPWPWRSPENGGCSYDPLPAPDASGADYQRGSRSSDHANVEKLRGHAAGRTDTSMRFAQLNQVPRSHDISSLKSQYFARLAICRHVVRNHLGRVRGLLLTR
jgi:hypothetical protein